MTSYCKKCCYDCPFRADIPPYQDQQQVVNNIQHVLDFEHKPAYCHHSDPTGGSTVRSKSVPRTLCAGWLTLTRQDQSVPSDFPVVFDPRVFPDLKSFIEKSVCKTNSTRWLAWYLSQPRHKQLRLFDELLDYLTLSL